MKYIIVQVLTSFGKTEKFSSSILSRQPEAIIVPCSNGNISKEEAIRFQYVVLKLMPAPHGIGVKRFIEQTETRSMSFNGNFIFSCDSRFRREYGHYPIGVHDFLNN